MQTTKIVSFLCIVAAAWANGARAQTAPVPLAQHTESPAIKEVIPDQTVVNLAAGATLNGGNTKTYSANAGGRVGLLRHPHQLSFEALTTVGYARNTTTDEVEQTTANAVGRGRYDLFLSRMDALFIAVQPRRDTYSGLNIRLQNQLGYLRNLYFPIDAHRFWTELGYDLTYDDFSSVERVLSSSSTSTTDPDTGIKQTTTLTNTREFDPGHDFVHSGRAFFGYTNLLTAVASLNMGADILFDVEDKKNVRVTAVAELNSSLTARFKLGVQFRLLFDNVPVTGVEKKADTITALQLIYTYDSLAGEPAPACAVCDCSAVVAEAKDACKANIEIDPAAVVAPQPAAEPAPEPAPAEPASGAPAPTAPAAPAAAPAPATP